MVENDKALSVAVQYLESILSNKSGAVLTQNAQMHSKLHVTRQTFKLANTEDATHPSDMKSQDKGPVNQSVATSATPQQTQDDAKSRMTPFKTELNRK